MLDDLKMIHQRDAHDVLGGAARHWQAVPQVADWDPQVTTGRNLAKQLALELMGRTVVIYGAGQLAAAAKVWKHHINQYAKQLAWQGEWDDAEILGWTKQPVHKLYAVVELHSSLEAESTRRRFLVAGRLLSGMRPVPVMVTAEGRTIEEQLAYCRALGEFTAAYLALLNGLDPSANDIIGKMNKELL